VLQVDHNILKEKMTIQPSTPFTKFKVSTLLVALLFQCQVQSLFISSAESHPGATVKISPRELGDHQQARAKKFNFGIPNVYEGKNLLKELLTERRLDAAIEEAEAAYKKANDAASFKAGWASKRGGQPLTGFNLGHHAQAIRTLKRTPSLMMDQALEDELNYAQQLATGIITDLRSILGDIQRDPSDPDRLLRLS